MTRTRRTARIALILTVLAATAAVSQIQLKNHSLDVVGSSIVACTDGVTFNGETEAASSLNILMTSEVWDATGTTLLATGNTHTYTALNEIFGFTVLGSFTAGSTIVVAITNTPGVTPVGGTEGDAATVTVGNCTLATVPAMPLWALALFVAVILAAATRLLRSVPLASVGGGQARYLGLILLLSAAFALAGTSTAGASANPLTWTKTFASDTIGPGSVSMMIFDIQNPNAHGEDMLAFTDTLPMGMTLASPAFVSNTCGGTVSATNGGSSVSLSDGMIASSGSCRLVFNVTAGVPAESAMATYTNTTGPLTSSAGSSGTATDDLMVVTSRPGFAKSFSPSTVAFGGRSTLTFTIDNSRNGSLVSFLGFTDNLPPGMVVAAPANVTNSCMASVFTGGEVTAVPGTDVISLDGPAAVAAGATCAITVDVIGGAVGDLGNVSGELTFVSFSTLIFSGKAAAVLEVTGFTDPLSVGKEFIDDPVVPGGTVTLEFTVTNRSRDQAATGITFTDTIDPMGSLTGLTPTLPPTPNPPCGTGSSLSFDSGTLTLSGGNLAAESSCTFRVALTVPSTASPDSYVNTTGTVSGTVGGSAETGNMASDVLFVVAFPQLTKEFTDDPVGAGNSVTLRFTITNTDTSSALSGITFVDELTAILPYPVTATLPSTPCGTGSSLAIVNSGTEKTSTLTLTSGTLMANDSMAGGTDTCTFDIAVDIPAGFPSGTYTNTTGELTATLDDVSGTPTVTGPAASDDLVVAGSPNLTKEFVDDPVLPGGSVMLEFKLVYSESATADATSIAFTDNLAALFTGLTATSVGTNTCNGTVDISTPTLISYSGGSMAAGEECSFRVTLSVPSGAPLGFHTNTVSDLTATVGAASVTGGPATDDLLVTPLTFTKAFTTDPVIAGDTTTLQFTLNNLGTVNATSISFSDSLSTTLSGLAATGSPTPNPPCGSSSVLSGTTLLVFSGGELSAGTSCSFTVPVMVPTGAADGIYPNLTSNLTADVGGVILLPPARDDLIVQSNILSLTKEFTDDPVAPGAPVTLEFTLENLSTTQTVTDVAFSDNLGTTLSGLTLTTVVSDGCGGTVSGTGTGLFSYSAGTLAPAATCKIRLTLTLPSGPLGGSVFPNTTTGVTGKVGSLNVTGAAASDDLTVRLLKLTKAFDGKTVAGGTAVLTFTLENLDSSAGAANLGFFDDLDAVISGLTATTLPAGSVCGGGTVSGSSFLTLAGASLGPSGTCTFDVTVTVPSTATSGSFLNTTSDLSQNGLPVAGPATAFLEIEPPPTFAKVFAPDMIGVGFPSTLTFTIDNTASTLAASNLDFLDMLPVGVTVAAAPNINNGCGGSVVAAAGGVSISLSNGTVAGGASCTLSVDVTVTTTGMFVNTTSNLTSSNGNSGTASDTLTGLGCGAADGTNQTLGNDVVLTAKTFEVCNTIDVEEHYLVLGPGGMVTFRAGVAVVLGNGVEFGNGSVVTIEIDPSLIPGSVP